MQSYSSGWSVNEGDCRSWCWTPRSPKMEISAKGWRVKVLSSLEVKLSNNLIPPVNLSKYRYTQGRVTVKFHPSDGEFKWFKVVGTRPSDIIALYIFKRQLQTNDTFSTFFNDARDIKRHGQVIKSEIIPGCSYIALSQADIKKKIHKPKSLFQR